MNVSGEKDEFRQVDADRRLDRLDERLDRLEASEVARTGRDKPEADPNYRMGNRVLADLIGGIAGGALIGWLVDRWFGSWPVGFLIFLALGIIVAFRNIFRIANAASGASGGTDSE